MSHCHPEHDVLTNRKEPSAPGSHHGTSRREFLAMLGAGAAAGVLAGRAGSSFAQPAADAPPPGALGAALRPGLLLAPDMVYLNTGSLGACPTQVLDATVRAWRDLEQNPTEMAFGPYITTMEQVRDKAAAFFGCDKDEMAITASTTDGMNIIAQGIDLREGDHVLTTDQEHPGGALCWAYFAKRRGVIIDTAALPLTPQRPEQIVESLAAKMTKATKVISVSHVLYTTGLRLPIARIAELARKHNALLVVDGAQAPGQPVDLKALGCHAYATSAHKWLLGPKGAGLLYVAADAKKRIDPMFLQSGSQVYTGATGTRAVPLVVGLGAAMDYLDAAGRINIENHIMQLREALMEGLRDNANVTILSPPAGEMASPIVTFTPVAGPNYSELAQALQEKHKIVVSAKDHIKGVRVSLHLYNSMNDVETLLRALKAEQG